MMARVDSFGNVIPAMRKGRAGLLAGIARSRKKAPAFAKQCKRKVAPRTLLANKAATGATAAAATTKLYMWGYDYYGRLGQGQHLGPKDKLKPDSCPQCEVITCSYGMSSCAQSCLNTCRKNFKCQLGRAITLNVSLVAQLHLPFLIY